MYEYDRGLVFVSFDDASRLFQTGGRATGLRLAVTDRYDAREVAERTARGFARDLDKKFYVDDWTRQHYTYFRSIQLQKAIMFVILLARDRGRRVQYRIDAHDGRAGQAAATSRSCAARHDAAQCRRDLREPGHADRFGRHVARRRARASRELQLGNLVALLQSWLGINLLSADVYFLSDLPTQLRPFEVAEIAVLALGLAILATLYPSFSAARQPPAEALRYE